MFRLNTGAEIPQVGLGTWKSGPGEAQTAVSYALKTGYKLVDCAYCYGNEDEVGQGLKDAFESGIKREDIFIVSKVWATYNTRVAEGLEKSLRSLGVDYVDLYLIHWPVLLNPKGNDDKFPTLSDGSRDVIRGWSHIDAWKQMEQLVGTGKVKAIGVCNYSKRYLEELLPNCTIKPAVNQIENHPHLPQQEIVDFSKREGIHIMAYSPMGGTGCPVAAAPPVVKLAGMKGVSPATILLSYHVARGSTVLSKSTTPSRIKANLGLIPLGPDDMELLDKYSASLAKSGELKRYVYPPFGVNLGFPDEQ